MDEKTIIDNLLDEVSQEEVEELEKVLAKLGLGNKAPAKVKHPKSKIKGDMTTYYLKVVYECSLCGSVSTTIFMMEAGQDGTYRISKEIKEDVPCQQIRKETLHFCKNCRNFLERQSNEKLISIIMRLVKCT
jgi:hypothetical protein